MSIINLDSSVVESIKKYCSSIDPNLNLSEYLKSKLSESDSMILSMLENENDSVDIDSFERVVHSFFEKLNFCGKNFDDEMMIEAKKEIGYFFEYLDKLDLSYDYSFNFIDVFFNKLNEYDLGESRGIYDLLTFDMIRNSKIMQAYLDSNYCHADNYCPVNIKLFAKHLYKCFESLEEDEIEKVKYVFYSSFETLEYFLADPEEMEIFFPYTIVSHFSKESMSLLFRAGSFYDYKEFFEAPEFFLEVVGAMCDYMVEKTGHSAEFLECLLPAFDEESKASKKMLKVFDEYYDKYFYDSLDNGFENDEVFKELLSIILDGDCLYFFLRYNADTIDKMHEGRIDFFNKLYNDIFENNNNLNLFNLKQAFFKRVYGINFEEVIFILSRYGKYLDECSLEFLEEDKATLKILKTIKEINEIKSYETEKIEMLYSSLCNYIKEKGLYNNKPENSFVMLRSLIDRMYMKTFNKELFRVNEEQRVLYTERGVSVIDAGLDFSMIVTAVNGVGDYYCCTENLLKRYNSSLASGNQGICASFINNENLGVIGLNGPLMAFANLSNDSLNAMGVGDIYSDTDVLSLKNGNKITGEGRFFLTPKQYADHSRFGYNEMVVDRFLIRDDDEKIKVQPSYIVCYKMDENYKTTRMYKRSIKMAKDFGIPVVLVDVLKVKEHERDTILEMEKELFSSDKVNKELMKAIITRYMNNYTGSLTIVRSRNLIDNGWDYKEDFSMAGLESFLEKVEEKFKNLDMEGINEWHSALEEAYNIEREKNLVALEISGYAHSLSGDEFVLDDEIHFMDRVNTITDRFSDYHYIREGKIDINSVVYNPKDLAISELEVMVNIGNRLIDKAFVASEDQNGTRIFMTTKASELSDEEKMNCGLIVSYLLGDYSHNYFIDFNQDAISEMNFDYNKHYMSVEIPLSSVYSDIKKTKELLNLVEKIYTMEEEDFIKIIKPLIDQEVNKKGVSENYIAKKLLKRKEKIFEEFSCLKEPSEKIMTGEKKK